MVKVKIVNGEKTSFVPKLVNILALSLGVLTALIILVSYDNPTITGYSVFSSVYGSFSPFIIVFLLLVIIFMYLKLR